jgi:hypothetical protein
MRNAVMLVVAMAGMPLDALAGIYTCTDAEGRTVFRDVPCARGERTGVAKDASTGRDKTKEKPAVGGAPLDRKQVERLVGRLDKAMSKRDPKAVTALLAKDAVVEVHSASGRAADPMDVKAFARYLTAAFARPGYVYQARPMRVSLSKSKPRATVTRAVRETVVVAGNVVVTDLQERLTVERDGRRVLIRKLRKAVPATEAPA